VKQGCPLSPILFHICIDPIFRFIRLTNPDSGFHSEALGERIIQGYADDIVLIANSKENLQNQINSAEKNFNFAFVKLNPKKCEILKIDKHTDIEDKIIIAREPKEYLGDDMYLKYLGIPLGSKRVTKVKMQKRKY
jgi:hypothetical protein